MNAYIRIPYTFPAILLVLSVVLLSCETVNQDGFEEFIVIESYAVAGRPLPDITISRTVDVNLTYDPNEAAVSDAAVRLHFLDENGNSEEVFEYLFTQTTPGLYRPADRQTTISAGRSYRFEVDVPGTPNSIRAKTTVPESFKVLNEVPERLVYQSDNQLEINITNTRGPNGQNVFVFSSIANEPDIENFTPFYRAVFDNEDDADINEFTITSSGLINEGNFDLNPDGTITLRFPWIGVAFYGENRVVTSSVDKNLFDLIRSQEVQLGGSTLSPGEIPNLIYNTEGGIGVFGSLSSDTVVTEFVRPF